MIQGSTILCRGYVSGLIWAATLLWVAISILLILGVLTPLASVSLGLGILGVTISNFPLGEGGVHFSAGAATCTVIVAVAVALLGPGAYSIDAKMFGRREILFPKKQDDPKK